MFFKRPSFIRETTTLTRQVTTGRSIIARIQVGDSLPEADLYEDYPTNKVRIPELTLKRNIIIFGVPGAFSPGCSKTHLPGYLRNAAKMKEGGIDEIVCVSVNDPYVMAAWGVKHDTKGKVRMLADPSGTFISSMGLGIHLATLGGLRSKRFSMIVTNNNIEQLNVEPDGTGLSCSLASQLQYKKYVKVDDKDDDDPINQ